MRNRLKSPKPRNPLLVEASAALYCNCMRHIPVLSSFRIKADENYKFLAFTFGYIDIPSYFCIVFNQLNIIIMSKSNVINVIIVVLNGILSMLQQLV